jgi:urea carboxylase-associated protein 1
MTSPVASPSIPDGSDAVYAHDIPAERPWSRVLKQGQTLRIVDSEGQQAVDALLYCADDTAERYSAQDTLRVQGSAYIELGTRLVSNRGRVMAHISADSCGRHDTSAGCCSCESNAVRFGEATKYQHACRENFILELSKHGLTKRDIVANLNFFMNVPIDPSGAFTVVDGISAPGNYVDVTADMDVLFVISNCPQVNNPCNGFDPTPIRVMIWDPPKA